MKTPKVRTYEPHCDGEEKAIRYAMKLELTLLGIRATLMNQPYSEVLNNIVAAIDLATSQRYPR